MKLRHGQVGRSTMLYKERCNFYGVIKIQIVYSVKVNFHDTQMRNV
jgi:hypothetical protein